MYVLILNWNFKYKNEYIFRYRNLFVDGWPCTKVFILSISRYPMTMIIITFPPYMNARDLVWWGFNDICPSTYTKGGHSRFNRLRARATVWQHHHKKKYENAISCNKLGTIFYNIQKKHTHETLMVMTYTTGAGRFYPPGFPRLHLGKWNPP